MKRAAILALVVLSATACTRRVVVESEPNRYEAAAAPAMIDITGTYDFVVDVGDQQATGPMTVTRAADGGYTVRITSNMGDVIPSNVRREGNTLMMDAQTPGGPGSVELTWQNANQVSGMVFIDQVYNMRATRRP